VCVYIYIYTHTRTNYSIYIYIYIYIYSIPPDDRIQACPKHVEVDSRNELRINIASRWFPLHGHIEMHGQQSVKKTIQNICANTEISRAEFQ